MMLKMNRFSLIGILSLACGAFAVSAQAATTIGSLNTAGFNPSAGHAYVGESFIVPAGETGLISATLVLNNTLAGTVNGTMRIYEFSDDGSNGAFGPQIGAQPISLPVGSTQSITQTFNVSVTAGSKYAVIADWGAPTNVGGYYSNSSYYPDGMTIFTGASNPVMHPSDIAFEVNFGVIPEPGMIAMLIPAGMLLRRRGS